MLVSTSSMLYSMQSRFIFTRAAEREKEEREDMFYLSVDEGGDFASSSSGDEGGDQSSSSSSSGLSSGSGSDDPYEWEPDPIWVVDENEVAMKKEWLEREKRREMLQKRADIKRRLKAERARRANALGALNAYHRRHHTIVDGQLTGGSGTSVVWGGEVGEEEDHQEEDLHERKRDSLALGRARASSLSSEGSGSRALLLSGGLPQSGLMGLKSSASLVRKQPSPTSSSPSSSPSLPRHIPATSPLGEAPRLAKSRALAVSPLAASAQTNWRSQHNAAATLGNGTGLSHHHQNNEPVASLSTSPRTLGSPLASPRLCSSSSSSSSGSSSSTSTSPTRAKPRRKAAKRGSRRRHSRSLNAVPVPPEPRSLSGVETVVLERPRAYSAGPQLPASRDSKAERKQRERKERKERKEREKREKKEKGETKKEKDGKKTGKGARLVRVLSGGKLRLGQDDRIKRESLTGVNPALLSDSAAQDNPYIAEYRRERNTPRGGQHAGWPAVAHEGDEEFDTRMRENEEGEEDGERGTREAEAGRGVGWGTTPTRGEDDDDEAAAEKRGAGGRQQVTNGGSGTASRTTTTTTSSSAVSPTNTGSISVGRLAVASGSSGSAKPAIPVLSLATVSVVRVDAPAHGGELESEASSSNASANGGSGIGSKLGAITPRMVEGFRSIVKKLGKSYGGDGDRGPLSDRPWSGPEKDDGDEESEESLSYSGSDSGSDSSESEGTKQRRRTRVQKLEKKRSMSDRSLKRSRSLSPRRARDLLDADHAVAGRSGRSDSIHHHRDLQRKGGSERRLRTGSIASGGSSPLARSPSMVRVEKSAAPSSMSTPASSVSSSISSPRKADAVKRDGLRHSDSSSSDLSSSNERVERRGRTMVRRAGDTWSHFLARLSPRTATRAPPSAASSPNLTSPGPASPSSSALTHHHDENDTGTHKAKQGSKSKKEKKPTRTRSEDRIDWGKDRINAPTSGSSSMAPDGKAQRRGLRSRSLSPLRQPDKLDREASRRKGKQKKRNH